MKPLHTRLQDITEEGIFLDALVKFLKSKKGKQMLDLVDRMPVDALCKRFEAPKMCRHMLARLGPTQRKNMLKAAMKTIGVKTTVKRTGMPNYEQTLYLKQKNGELKLAPSLTKYEQKCLNKRDQWVIKRDDFGKPMIAVEKDSDPNNIAGYRTLYDKQSGKPIYKYTPKPKGAGIAWKCNAYANHKIDKWLARHPEPTALELKMDLFPGDLMAAWRTRRNIAVEAIRNAVAAKYYKVKDPTQELRLFEVGISHRTEGEDVTWESECDPYVYGYPLSKYPNMSLMTMQQKLSNAMNHASSNVVALKVYDRYGNMQCYVDRETPKLRIAA